MKTYTREELYRPLKDKKELTALHEQVTASPYRQHYHIQPISGLLNDPNGFARYDNKWHLFYQWCPWGAFHGMKNWYHVISDDLIQWQNKGVAIKPDSEYDNKGCFSGTAYVEDDTMRLYYTGNHRTRDWLRSSYVLYAEMDKKGRFTKNTTPIISPRGGYTWHQRDPQIIKHDGQYYILLGAQSGERHGRVIIFHSSYPDKDFNFYGELKVPGFEDFGDMWECPSIRHIDDKDVLFFCPQHLTFPSHAKTTSHCGYLVGRLELDKLTFTPETPFQFLDQGMDLYAAQTAANTDDNIIIGWMGLPDATYPTDDENWSGCLTLPRQLTLKNGRLLQAPLDYTIAIKKEIDPGLRELPEAAYLDIKCHNTFSFNLFTHKDGHGGLMFYYDDSTQQITIDRSFLEKRFNKEKGESRSYTLSGPLYQLRVFIDSSSVEIFVNNGEAVFTSRVFPTKDEHSFIFVGSCEPRVYELKDTNDNSFIV